MVEVILTLVVLALVALFLRWLGADPVWTKVIAVIGIEVVILWLASVLGIIAVGKITL